MCQLELVRAVGQRLNAGPALQKLQKKEFLWSKISESEAENQVFFSPSPKTKARNIWPRSSADYV